MPRKLPKMHQLAAIPRSAARSHPSISHPLLAFPRRSPPLIKIIGRFLFPSASSIANIPPGGPTVTFRLRLQLEEALGSHNRWFCSQFHRREIRNPEILLSYFIRSGGAADFARRYNQAMSPLNRWYCSEFHARPIDDPEILWNYYINHQSLRAPRHHQQSVA
jgi:hypothetical protein